MRFSGRAFDDGYARVAPSAATSLVIQSILATFLCWAGNGLAFLEYSILRYTIAIVSPSELSDVQCPQYMKYPNEESWFWEQVR